MTLPHTEREAPVVEIYPREPKTVRVGESAMLSCRAIVGIPKPTVVWSRHDGRPFSLRIDQKISDSEIH